MSITDYISIFYLSHISLIPVQSLFWSILAAAAPHLWIFGSSSSDPGSASDRTPVELHGYVMSLIRIDKNTLRKRPLFLTIEIDWWLRGEICFAFHLLIIRIDHQNTVVSRYLTTYVPWRNRSSGGRQTRMLQTCPNRLCGSLIKSLLCQGPPTIK